MINTEITPGMIVSYTNEKGRVSHYRVRKVTKNTVNLGAIFGRALYYKGVDKSLVIEDEAAWYKKWQQSETYMCM